MGPSSSPGPNRAMSWHFCKSAGRQSAGRPADSDLYKLKPLSVMSAHGVQARLFPVSVAEIPKVCAAWRADLKSFTVPPTCQGGSYQAHSSTVRVESCLGLEPLTREKFVKRARCMSDVEE